MRHIMLGLTLTAMPALCAAQATAQPARTPAQEAALARATDARTLGWQVRADNPKADASKLVFAEMKPGWHVTTGPVSAVLFHPGTTGTGNYTATLSVFFFPPKSTHQEGYGMLVGGKDLAGARQQYTYFIVRNDGKFMIKRRNGDSTSTVMPWTDTPALKLWKEGAPVLNVLSVTAGSSTVQFKINDTVVATKPRSEIGVDGVVGIRANHMLDLHVRDLTVVAAK